MQWCGYFYIVGCSNQIDKLCQEFGVDGCGKYCDVWVFNFGVDFGLMDVFGVVEEIGVVEVEFVYVELFVIDYVGLFGDKCVGLLSVVVYFVVWQCVEGNVVVDDGNEIGVCEDVENVVGLGVVDVGEDDVVVECGCEFFWCCDVDVMYCYGEVIGGCCLLCDVCGYFSFLLSKVGVFVCCVDYLVKVEVFDDIDVYYVYVFDVCCGEVCDYIEFNVFYFNDEDFELCDVFLVVFFLCGDCVVLEGGCKWMVMRFVILGDFELFFYDVYGFSKCWFSMVMLDLC